MKHFRRLLGSWAIHFPDNRKSVCLKYATSAEKSVISSKDDKQHYKFSFYKILKLILAIHGLVCSHNLAVSDHNPIIIIW